MTNQFQILVIEDDRADVFLIREALREAGIEADLQILSDGEQAASFIRRADADDALAVPDLILLDLNLPRKSGADLLNMIRQSRRFSAVNVIIVTSSNAESDSQQASRLGANAYFCKPSSYEGFLKLGPVAKSFLFVPSE